MDDADRLALAQEWHAQGGPVAGANGVGLAHGKLGPGGGKVVDVDGLSVQDGAARNPSTAYRSTPELHRLPDRPDWSVMHQEVELFPLPQHDHRIVGFAEPHRALGDGVKDRLDVGGRARDDPQDFRRRRLLFQGLGQPPLKVANLGVVALRRLAGDRGLGSDLGLRRLWTPAHRLPLASYESAGDRLRRTCPPGQVAERNLSLVGWAVGAREPVKNP